MAAPSLSSSQELAQENARLRQQLQDAEDLLAAIRSGGVDALALPEAGGPRFATLEGSDQGYRTLIEQMNEGALLLADTDVVLYANDCAAGLLGRPLEAVMGAVFQDFVPLELRPYWAQVRAAGWAGRSKGELPLETADGMLQPFALALSQIDFNGVPALAVIVTDLADKREISSFRARVAEQNELLARQNDELRQQTQAREAVEQVAAATSRILESIPQIAWTANADGRKLYLNQRWYDYTGEQPPAADDPIGIQNQVERNIHPADLPRVLRRWQHSLRQGTPFELEFRVRGRTGDYRWMLARALPTLHDTRQQVAQWVGTYTDIHDARLLQERQTETQQQLQTNNEQLTRVNVDLDNFIYTASHDLKAPIANIEGLVYVLQDQLPAATPGLAADVQPILGMMLDAVHRFQRTIDQLTDVTKLQKAQEQPVEQLALAAVVRDVLLDLAPLVQAAQADVQVQVPDNVSIAFSEKNLRSVVYNLLSNALKYRHPQRRPLVRVACAAHPDSVVLTVQDNGLGLTAEQQTELFTMFRRFHSGVEGTGVGLYMVKKIVENMGGHLTVESSPEVGSTFTVYFRR